MGTVTLPKDVECCGRVTREDDGRGWTTTIRYYGLGRQVAIGAVALLTVASVAAMFVTNTPEVWGALATPLLIMAPILATCFKRRRVRIRVSNGQFQMNRWSKRPVAEGLIEEASIEHNAYGPDLHMINIHHDGALLHQVYPARDQEAMLLAQSLKPHKRRENSHRG